MHYYNFWSVAKKKDAPEEFPWTSKWSITSIILFTGSGNTLFRFYLLALLWCNHPGWFSYCYQVSLVRLLPHYHPPDLSHIYCIECGKEREGSVSSKPQYVFFFTTSFVWQNLITLIILDPKDNVVYKVKARRHKATLVMTVSELRKMFPYRSISTNLESWEKHRNRRKILQIVLYVLIIKRCLHLLIWAYSAFQKTSKSNTVNSLVQRQHFWP